jgi:hypothetical protein
MILFIVKYLHHLYMKSWVVKLMVYWTSKRCFIPFEYAVSHAIALHDCMLLLPAFQMLFGGQPIMLCDLCLHYQVGTWYFRD